MNVWQIDIEENWPRIFKKGKSLLPFVKDALEIVYSRRFDHSGL